MKPSTAASTPSKKPSTRSDSNATHSSTLPATPSTNPEPPEDGNTRVKNPIHEVSPSVVEHLLSAAKLRPVKQPQQTTLEKAMLLHEVTRVLWFEKQMTYREICKWYSDRGLGCFRDHHLSKSLNRYFEKEIPEDVESPGVIVPPPSATPAQPQAG